MVNGCTKHTAVFFMLNSIQTKIKTVEQAKWVGGHRARPFPVTRRIKINFLSRRPLENVAGHFFPYKKTVLSRSLDELIF